MPVRLSRRQFLRAAAGLGAAAALPPADPGPLRLFVPPENYRPLPPDCYADRLIRPSELILHWDGNRHGRELWKVRVMYETLAYVGQSSHFGVDDRVAWQFLPMYQGQVQESYGAKGHNRESINVEMAGRDFDEPGMEPTEAQVWLTVQLVSRLMDHYGIPARSLYGHFERDERGLKHDPGVNFMAAFRQRLAAFRDERGPADPRRRNEK